jgi:Immunity protein 50
MWLDLVEQSVIVTSIFKDEDVSLKNVKIVKIEIDCLNGWDFRIWLDLNDFPINVPPKWQKSNYNVVQLSLRFLENEIIKFENSNLNNVQGEIEIYEEKGFKKVFFKNTDFDIIFELKCKWIYINHISAYTNSTN